MSNYNIKRFTDICDNGKHLFRRGTLAGKPFPHKVGHDCKTSGMYISGVEFFKHKNAYWFKMFTTSGGVVYEDTIIKFSKEGEVKLYKINFFYPSFECKKYTRYQKQDIDNVIEMLNEYLDSDDPIRKIIIK